MPQAVVDLYYLPKLSPVCIDYDKVCLVGIGSPARICEVLLINLVYFKDALHLSNVQIIGNRVVQDMKLYNCELEEHLVVFEELKLIELIKGFEDFRNI